ncbi:MAG: hypothetical protein RMM58_01170 [Chloroflexota bacterium]|nr:hypothetical protein [Dehalococcoidia bacterium]MDW8252469.1 hypothetical protein [Chloroflexota bacterium]
MSIYVLTERRVAAEDLPAYLDLIRQTRERWVAGGGLLFNRLAISVDDPTHVLGITRWRTAEAFTTSLRETPPELLAAFAAVVEKGYGDWQFYRPVREIENFALRAQFLLVELLTVPSDEVERFLATCQAAQERAIQLPGIAASRLLQAVDDRTRILGICELAEEEAASRRQALLEEVFGAFPHVATRSFSGRIGAQWELPPISARPPL